MNAATRIHRLMHWIMVLVLAGGCTSLRNEVDPSQLGLAAPKLVVSCFLSPQDTLLTVKVTRSSTVVGDSLSLLQTGHTVINATVTLSEGGRSVVLPYNNLKSNPDSVQSFYSIAARLLPIRAGRTYTLTVVTPAGERASSVCTIPQPVDPTSIKFDSLTQVQNRKQTERYYVQVRWQDPAGQVNAYQVAGIFRYTINGPNFREEKYNGLSFDDDNRGLFTDAGLDGTMMVSGRAYLTSASSSGTPTGTQPQSFYSQYKTALVTVNLMSVDQSYYRYQEAIIRQRRSRNNPFAEPVLIPSNINGGLGCFAGYNNATMTLTLK